MQALTDMDSITHPRDAGYVFLDLDGTLTDPSQGITGGVLYVLERFGIREDDRRKLCSFIGPPLYGSFMKYYGFSREEAYRGVEVFQEYYSAQGWSENVPYPGIRELLAEWKAEGRKLVLATSKPEVFAVRILEHFGMADSFELIAGGDVEETRVEKAMVIDYARTSLGLNDLRGSVMIGDTSYDVIGAAKHGIPTVGVLYGFGSRASLEEAGARWLAGSVDELRALMRR